MNEEQLEEIFTQIKKLRPLIADLPAQVRNKIIFNISGKIDENREELIDANSYDLKEAEKSGLQRSFIDRLRIDNKVIDSMIKSLNEIAFQPDFLGDVLEGSVRPNGLIINKVRVPIGVIAIIYESRPSVTVDTAALAIKSGNCIILKGGKEAINSNRYLVSLIHAALTDEDIPPDVVYFISNNKRELLIQLLKSKSNIDMIIPRGGKSLINFVTENSLIPVVKHDAGLCHVYVDKFANREMASQIIFNSKLGNVSACNALETLLVHKDIASHILPTIETMLKSVNVDLRVCDIAQLYIEDCRPAIEEDWETEYLDKILSIKVVDGIDAAIEHIEKYSTGHSECIVTESYTNAQKFLNKVDAAVVYVNASTRFTDGGEFGLGAEIGISTQKLHARGPMGAKDLTTIKYQVYGRGQLRE